MVGVITEIDDKLNKRHITVEKLYRKRTETEQNFKKNYDTSVEVNPAPVAWQARALPLQSLSRHKLPAC